VKKIQLRRDSLIECLNQIEGVLFLLCEHTPNDVIQPKEIKKTIENLLFLRVMCEDLDQVTSEYILDTIKLKNFLNKKETIH
jgi:hypothetical protein